MRTSLSVSPGSEHRAFLDVGRSQKSNHQRRVVRAKQLREYQGAVHRLVKGNEGPRDVEVLWRARWDFAVTGDEPWLRVEDPQTPGQLAVEVVRAKKKKDQERRKVLREKLLGMTLRPSRVPSRGAKAHLLVEAASASAKAQRMPLYEESHAKGCTEGSVQLSIHLRKSGQDERAFQVLQEARARQIDHSLIVHALASAYDTGKGVAQDLD